MIRTHRQRLCLRAALIVGAALFRVASGIAASAPSHIANYTIQATYDASAHRLTAHELLTWHNTTRETAVDLYFHLYLNAFANNRSSLVRDAGDAWIDWLKRHPHGWGYITINALRIGGADLTPR